MPEVAEETAEGQSQEIVAARRPSIAQRARGAFDAGQMDLIFSTVAKDLDQPAERAMFLEICVRHDFDPFLKEIWAYKKSGKVVIQVSRDGLLSKAERHTPEGEFRVSGDGMFQGVKSGVVYEHDFFDVRIEERADGTDKYVVDHRPRDKEGKPTFGGEDSKERGKMLGSWATCRRKGRDDVFFQAFADQYVQPAARGPVWGSHPHAMMQKCAESVVIRKAFSITGVVGEGELIPSRTTVTATSGGGTGEIQWPEDPELVQELQRRFEVLGHRRAKVRVLVNACESEDDFKALLAKLDGEIDAAGVEMEEEPPEAEVVPDEEPPVDPEFDAPVVEPGA